MNLQSIRIGSNAETALYEKVAENPGCFAGDLNTLAKQLGKGSNYSYSILNKLTKNKFIIGVRLNKLTPKRYWLNTKESIIEITNIFLDRNLVIPDELKGAIETAVMFKDSPYVINKSIRTGRSVEDIAFHDYKKAKNREKAKRARQPHVKLNAIDPSTQPPAPRLAMPAATTPATDPLAALDTTLQHIGLGLAAIIKRHLFSELADVMQQLEKALPEATPTTLEAILTAQPRQIHPPAPEAAQASKLPRVAIVGLLPSQAGHIHAEYCDAFDLRFIETNENLAKLSDSINKAEYVIGATSFINHSIDDILKKHKNYVRYTGGLSKLRECLTTIYRKTEPVQ